MFDLSLTQQLPSSALASPQFVDSFKQCIQLIALPFALEEKRDYTSAIQGHKNAITLLEKIQKVSGIRKFNRKMYEKQAEVHRERVAYLEGLNGNYDSAVRVPSRGWALNAKSTMSSSTEPLSSLGGSNPPIEYTITHDSELIDVGVRSIWYILKDPTTNQTHYAAQAIWDMEKPMIEAVLRRADGIFPFGEAIHTAILKQGKPGLNFKMRMVRRGTNAGDEVWEIPASTAAKKEWSPRHFSLNGRHFVWKNEDGKDGGILSKKWGWETLYETRDGQEGSEVIGSKLAWGKTQGGFKGKWYLYVVEGLDLVLREHILASQLSRFLRWTNPPDKDLSGLEKGAVAVGAVGNLISLTQMLG